MFKLIDNKACTIYLNIIGDFAVVWGDVRTFTKASYKDTFDKWTAALIALKEDGCTRIFSQIQKAQGNILRFEQRLGFKIHSETDTDLILIKEL